MLAINRKTALILACSCLFFGCLPTDKTELKDDKTATRHAASEFRTTDLVVDDNASILAPVGVVNTTPAALYVVGTIGVGDPPANTPGTYIDSRHNYRAGWDDMEIVMAGPNTANGIQIDYVRSYGDLYTHTSTSTGTEIDHIAVWGYGTDNVIKQGARERWMVDQPNSAVAVQMSFVLWMADTAGRIHEAFRFDSTHHFSVLDTSPPTVTLCGTGATVTGSDGAGTITFGAAATGCTLTFFQRWDITAAGVLARCTMSSHEGVLFKYAVYQGGFVITAIGDLSSTTLDYICIGGGQGY